MPMRKHHSESIQMTVTTIPIQLTTPTVHNTNPHPNRRLHLPLHAVPATIGLRIRHLRHLPGFRDQHAEPNRPESLGAVHAERQDHAVLLLQRLRLEARACA